MKNTKMPAIRFKGFNDDWEQRKLGDVIEKLTGGASIAPDDYVDVGYRTIPKGAVNSSGVADMSGCKNVSENFFKKNISSKTSSGELVTSLRDLVPTAPNMGRIVRICGETEDFLMPQGVYSIIVKEKISEDFLITYSNSPEYRKIIMAEKNGSTQVHIRNGEFLNIDIPLPSYEEQMKIGEHFKTLNHLITLHQRKLEKIKLMKKSMLGKMFSRDAESIPKIRFDGYTDDWEQRKLGELYQRNTERNENLIGYDKTISVATMSYKDDGNGASESSLSTYKVLRVGDIAFEGHTNKQFRFGRFVVNDIGTGIMSPRFSTLRPLNEMPVNFWKQYIHSESVMRRILVNSTKAGTMMNELVIPEFLNQTIMVPSENEQAVIGQYFSNLDHLITLHQRKLEKLKKVKKSLLEHMFPMEK